MRDNLDPRPSPTIIAGEIERVKLMAQYWLIVASTGGSERIIKSKVRVAPEDERPGGNAWRDMTPEEKIDDALRTALSFISSLPGYYENLAKLVESR